MSIARYFNPGLRPRILANDEPAWLAKHSRRRYIIAVVMSTPPWVDRDALRAVRREAKRLTETTGVPHVMDHIVPLCHPYVSGLTVPWNLQAIPRTVNAAKGNKWSPDQLELAL